MVTMAPTTSNTPLTARHQAMKTLGFYDGSQGYGAGQESAKYRALTPAQRQQVDSLSATGTMPLLQEPLHEWEKGGLTGMAAGTDTSQMSNVFQQLQGMLGSNGMLGKATAPVTPEEVAAMANPNADALKSKLSTTAERLRAQATTGQGTRGARSFGDTATGVERGLISEAELQGNKDIDFDTWNSALAQINAERDRMLNGTGVGISGNTAAYGMAGGIADKNMENNLSKLTAGKYVRDYNQNIDDVLLSEILAKQGDPLARLTNSLNLTKNWQSNNSNSQTGGMDSGLMQAGGVMSSLAGLAKMFI